MGLTSDWRSPALLCTTFVRWDTSYKRDRDAEGGKKKRKRAFECVVRLALGHY